MKKFLIIISLIVIAFGGSSYAVLTSTGKSHATPQVPTDTVPITPEPVVQPPAPTVAISTPKPTPAPTPDVKAAHAQVCLAIMNNSKSVSTNYDKMFDDSWKEWNSNFAGRYDSQEAQDSKNWYKNYIKNLFNNYINSTNQSYVTNCGGGSVTDVLNQPNYDAWQ